MGNAPSGETIGRLAALLTRPLGYAAKGDFALLFRLTGFSATSRRIISRMREAPDYARWQSEVDRLDELLAGFDTLAEEEKRSAVTRSLALLREIISDTGSPGTADRPAPSAAPPGLPAALEKLRTPVEYVKGVGPRRGELLRKRGIETVEDLLFLIPRYYIDVRRLNTIRELVHKQQGALIVEVVAGGNRYSKRTRKRLYELIVTDGRDVMTLVWFNAPYMQGRFKNGAKLLVRGVVSEYNFKKSMAHPDVEPWEESEQYRGRLIPRYPLTEGISLKTMVSIVGSALDTYGPLLPDGVPEEIRGRLGLMPVREAIRQIHDPADGEPALSDGSYPPVRSLATDELFILEIGLLLRKKNIIKSPGRSYRAEGRLMDSFLHGLSFSLTAAQDRVLSEVVADIRAPHPTHRLIQGDVGCGKTVVACAAALIAVEERAQAALMAPTEILAEQHYRNLSGMLAAIGVSSALLTSSVKGKRRGEVLSGIADGSISLVFGTHALISTDVRFRDLGLVVIDEQHRFGVLQRGALKDKGPAPEMIVMTATPIPRTLALTVYGDLDVSVIDQLPPGRIPPTTLLFSEDGRPRAYEIIREELKKGRQAFCVYPLVEESETLPLKDAVRMADELTKVFSEYRVGLITGRMKGALKEETMGGFARGEIHVLVSTTVVEVGVDVPNATVMVIEHADRYGLSQLHQLRGRVGRAADRSFCILMADFVRSEDATRRLDIMTKTTDGFVIAEEDLKIRGPGEFMGTRQSGLPAFRAVDLTRDYRTLLAARKEAESLLGKDPDLSDPAHRATREIMMSRFAGRLSLVDIG
ncbi:MAG: ATP-dependent DNA helicase RecG [Deltaproteobacteria bacterium]|nr:ATP-dependent DNA helicase RecG [Candidatus Zymogenaceae bacterium]